MKAVEELSQYFPDYTQKQLPERDYLFAIVSTLKSEELEDLVLEAQKKRSIYEAPEMGDFVEISTTFKEEIDRVLSKKSKCFLSQTFT